MTWRGLIGGLKESDPIKFGSVTVFTGLRGLTSGLVRLNRLEGTGRCTALWETPAGPIWGRLSDESSLEALFIEQLVLRIYQNDLIGVVPGDVVLDVGSHLGTFTKLALRQGARLVVAFDPEPTNIRCFKRTFREEIDEERVILVEAAAWNEPGTLSFSNTEESGTSTAKVLDGGGVEVEAVKIDDVIEELGLDRVDFMKMDIEGAERRALQGATRILAKFGPRMALSTYHNPDDPQMITKLVLDARPSYQVIPAAGFSYFFEGPRAGVSGGGLERAMVGLDRRGRPEQILSEDGAYSFPRFSPDGTRLAFVTGGKERNIWSYSFQDGTRTQLTFESGIDWSPVWSPDGGYLAYSATHGGGHLNIFRVPADGSGRADRLTESSVSQIVESWAPDGKTLVFSQLDPLTGSDIWSLSLAAGSPRPFLVTEGNEGGARFSPDGRWLAYTSDKNGYLSVYACPSSNAEESTQISAREGWYPRWGSNGAELFYRVGSKVMAVPVTTDGVSLERGEPREVFSGEYALGFHLEGGAWDVSSDGERFVMFEDKVESISLDMDDQMR
jgi:FkbM family methyltransferase